jgi:hypothetical protein
MGQPHWFCRSDDEWKSLVERLKLTPCPHCKVVGTLNRHGFLRGRDDSNLRKDTVRARRVFCSNRLRRSGCGRTISVWIADKIRRLQLTSRLLLQFLERAIAGTLADAIRKTPCHLCGRTLQRIWRRFVLGQSRIRTALAAICPPPESSASKPVTQVLAHLQAAFPESADNPIADFQSKTASFFV